MEVKMEFNSVLNPDKARLDAVLRCIKCEEVVCDSAGPVEGEEALLWLERHLKESPGCA